MEPRLTSPSSDFGSEVNVKPRSGMLLKGEGEGVGTNERAGVVQISVGLPLPPGLGRPDLELPSMVELSKCFCIWSEMRERVGTDREKESSSLVRESLLSVSSTENKVIYQSIQRLIISPGESKDIEDLVSRDEAEEKPPS